MNHMMVDIETLGTVPGSAIVSIGAVVFDETSIQHELEININLESCFDVGLTVDAKTLVWWLGQSKDAIDATFNQPTMFIREAISELASFYEENMCQRLWSHGATFDAVLLAEAARYCKTAPILVDFRNVRDTRTLYEIADVKPRDFMAGGTAHKAIDDARAQALAVIAAWDIIELWKIGKPVVAWKPGVALNRDCCSPKACDTLLVKSSVADLEVPAFLQRTTKTIAPPEIGHVSQSNT